jgi:CheY-like chemotaxis protein
MQDGAGAKLVLIVDDFPESVDGLFEALEMKGFAIALALDGEDGLRAANERRPDVIVMDLAMPKLDGLEAARRLKADPRTKSIPVVLFTGHAGPELEVLAEQNGCACVVKKADGASVVVDAVTRLCA